MGVVGDLLWWSGLGQVTPAADLITMAKSVGARVVVVNPGEHVAGDLADLTLSSAAEKCCPSSCVTLWKLLRAPPKPSRKIIFNQSERDQSSHRPTPDRQHVVQNMPVPEQSHPTGRSNWTSKASPRGGPQPVRLRVVADLGLATKG